MIRVGPAGWSYPDWEGRVYPRPRPAGFHPLPWLARYTSCLELNASFYRIPEPPHVERWIALLADAPGFRLTAKLHQAFTHEPLPERASEWDLRAERFRRALEPARAAGRLSALLVQFPVSFARTSAARERLARIAALFDGLPRVLEVRHRSWFDAEAGTELRALGYSLAHVDLPAAPEHPPPHHAPTGPIGYLRLHGRNAAQWFRKGAGRDDRYDWLYSPAELDELAARARRLASDHDEVFVVTNNHFGGQALANAIELRERLEGGPVAAPPTLVETFPRLAAVARPEGQGRLF